MAQQQAHNHTLKVWPLAYSSFPSLYDPLTPFPRSQVQSEAPGQELEKKVVTSASCKDIASGSSLHPGLATA